ncbi:MAG: protein translocase subunit SecD [Limnochordales bacterium]|nr:MAG: protein translocase subunit SecD [Bacillota bacterium]
MARDNVLRIVAILVIVAVTGVILYRTPIQLGLDLQGGIHIVLEARDPNVTDEAMQGALAVIERRINALGVAEPTIQRQGARRIVVELPGVTDHQQAVDVIGRTAVLEILDPFGRVALTGADLRDARVGLDQFNQPAIDIEFTPEGAEKFARLTTLYVGEVIPHLLDGEVLVAPVVRQPITGGTGQITGNFTYEEARSIAIQLKHGALPVALEVESMSTVGATLGRESVEASLKAAVVGLVLVVLFMLAYYRLPGFLADFALGVYVLIALALLAQLGATLTLPGIAGFILSIGMAVDANVLIFERIKDELRAGKRMRAALRSGFQRAFVAIFDANLTTLIAVAALYYFGTGPVRGFAVTLGLGILASMFTAVVITRWLLGLAIDLNPKRAENYFGVREAAS